MQSPLATGHRAAAMRRDILRQEKVKRRRKKQEELPPEVFSKLYVATVCGRRQAPPNMVFAPLSVELALALLLQGVDGRTADEINVFFERRRPMDVVQELYDAILAGKSQSSSHVALIFSNKILTDSNFQIDKKFKALASRGFFTDLEYFDFHYNPRQSVQEINQSVNTEYRGIFNSVLTEDDISAETKLVLTNMMYFKGKWKYRFHSEMIQKLPFFVSSTRFKEVEMMTNQEYYGYRNLKDLNAKMLVVPYAGDKFCLVIILPNEIDGIYEVEENMSKTNLMKELQLVTHPEVELFLPRFKIESKLDLTDDLKDLGIESLFDPLSADLSHLIKTKGLCLNKIVQKTVIEVNEESSPLVENFLATPKRISASKTRTFKVDHPFLFYVVNTEWQNVLYIGRYRVPDVPGCTMSSTFSLRS